MAAAPYQDLRELLVRDVGQLFAVKLGDDKLQTHVSREGTSGPEGGGWEQGKITVCPRLRGPMSRKASVFSLSNSFRQGISPVGG